MHRLLLAVALLLAAPQAAPAQAPPEPIPPRIAGFRFGGSIAAARATCRRAGGRFTLEYRNEFGAGAAECSGSFRFLSLPIATVALSFGVRGRLDAVMLEATAPWPAAVERLERAFGPAHGSRGRSASWRFAPRAPDWLPNVVSAFEDSGGAITIDIRSPAYDDG